MADRTPPDYWRCITCGGTAPNPLTDESRCKCADIYDQQWVRSDSPLSTSTASQLHTDADGVRVGMAQPVCGRCHEYGHTADVCGVSEGVKR